MPDINQKAELDKKDDHKAKRLRQRALLLSNKLDLEKRAADNARELAESNIRLLREITERREAEEELRNSDDRIRLLLESAGEGIYGVDPQGLCTFINNAALEMLGYQREQLLGAPIYAIVHKPADKTKNSDNDVDWPVLRAIKNSTGVRVNHEILRCNNGHSFAAEYSSYPMMENNKVSGAVVVFRDITTALELANRLSYQATHDALTGLVNRGEFETRVNSALEEAHVDNTHHALLYLDLDQFKVVNDTCGHSGGDELLRQLATKLQCELRNSDTLARLGGDEFGVLLKNCPIETALRIAENLRETVDNFRLVWNQQSFAVGVSIGAVPMSADTGTLSTVMSAADSACYAAKDSGRNRVHVYALNDSQLAQRRSEMRWANKIREAHDHDRFVLYFQSIALTNDLSDLTSHYEVLVRMQDAENKLVPPGLFMPAAERYNLMPQVDRWVVGRTLEWLSRHNEHLEQLTHCAINISGATLTDSNFLTYITALIGYGNVDPEKICLEITETAAVQDLHKASLFIEELQNLGCRFALDDFGSGMSSFGYLRNLAVDYLKIDGSFVKGIAEDKIDLAMVKSINEIGHVMGKKTIAEFVENNAILEKLIDLGVDYVQGYGIAAPRPIDELNC